MPTYQNTITVTSVPAAATVDSVGFMPGTNTLSIDDGDGHGPIVFTLTSISANGHGKSFIFGCTVIGDWNGFFAADGSGTLKINGSMIGTFNFGSDDPTNPATFISSNGNNYVAISYCDNSYVDQSSAIATAIGISVSGKTVQVDTLKMVPGVFAGQAEIGESQGGGVFQYNDDGTNVAIAAAGYLNTTGAPYAASGFGTVINNPITYSATRIVDGWEITAPAPGNFALYTSAFAAVTTGDTLQAPAPASIGSGISGLSGLSGESGMISL